MTEPLLDVRGLHKRFPLEQNLIGRVSRWNHAVNDVSFSVQAGETLAIVGESGSGKSTIGRLVLRLIDADSGTVMFRGSDVMKIRGSALTQFRSRARMVFQDPFSSLDPRMTIGSTVAEPLAIRKVARRDARDRALDLLQQVGLRAEHYDRYPHEFSGGQLQRVAIARAIATEPELIVCDEPTAALDMSIQAQIVNLLGKLQRELSVALLFISHDLNLVRQVADRVIVLFAGRIVEAGPTAEVFAHPRHPYTRALVAAQPRPGRKPAVVPTPLQGFDVPAEHACAYASRCPHAWDSCWREPLPLMRRDEVDVRCLLHSDATAPVLPGLSTVDEL